MTFIWEQLADRFGDYDEHVIFESINEPRLVETDHEWWLDMNAAECVEAVECINEWNQNFVDVVRKTGGNNATRYLMVPGYDASADGVLNDKFVLPTDTAENEERYLSQCMLTFLIILHCRRQRKMRVLISLMLLKRQVPTISTR